MDRSSSQCPNCHHWFSNWHSLLLHLSSCWQKYDNKEHGHGIFEHNPLKLSYDFCKSTNDKGWNEPIANDQCGKLFKRKTMDNYEMSFSSPTCNNTDITNDDIDILMVNHLIMTISMVIIMILNPNQVLLYQRFKSSPTI
jgi:hypothetical protein